MRETTNCKNEKCRALVYADEVPTKETGYCWRCEVDRLKRYERDLLVHLKTEKKKVFELEKEIKRLNEKIDSIERLIDREVD